MSEKQYVSYGSAKTCSPDVAAREITGCRFSIAPMSDNFVDILLSALKQVDTSKLWSGTDALSTVYRGKNRHVVDALKACFIHAVQAGQGVHTTMEATFSRGCPGDTAADYTMTVSDEAVNEAAVSDIHFPVLCKIALYPMGVENYMEYIAAVVNRAIDLGIYEGTAHYCTVLRCDVQSLFAYFEEVNNYCAEHVSHYVLEASLSVNSPSERSTQ